MTTYELVAIDGEARYPVATLPFKPGDVIVVHVPDAAPLAEIERLRERLHTLFLPERVLIVRDGVRFLRLEAVE